MKKYLNTPDEIVDGKTVRRAFSGNIIKSIDAEKRQIEFIISTACVDRYGDIVEVNGWDLKNYKANPVILFGHMSSIPPIGKALKTWKDGDALRSIAEFMPQDISAFAYSVFRMFQEKYLNAVSVGFRPLKYERIVDEDGNETWSYRFKKQELLEFSAVPIPANPEALVAARSKGIDTAPFKAFAEEMLDRWNETSKPLQEIYGVDRKQMENIRRRAAGAGATYRVPVDLQDEIMKRNLAAIRAAKAAKENQSVLEKFTLRGVEYELPLLDRNAKGIVLGTVVTSVDEINGKNTFHIDKADNSALFTKESLDHEEHNDFVSLEKKEGDDAESGLILTLRADNLEVKYNLIAATKEGDLYGMKIGDTPVEVEVATEETTETQESTEEQASEEAKESTEGEEDETADDESVEDEADESSEDDASEGDEEDDATAVEGGEDEDEDEKSAADTVVEKGKNKTVDEGDNEEITLEVNLLVLQNYLSDLEDALDKHGKKAHTRRELRSMEFLAKCLREVADRLDGGKGKDKGIKELKNTPVVPPVVETQEELTEEEASEYLKGMMSSLKPLLTEMITSKISKIRGRLD